MLASLLLVGSIVFVGLGTGVAASATAVAVPVGSTSTVEDVSDPRLNTANRRRAPRSVSVRSASAAGPTFERGARPDARRSVLDERPLVRLLRLAPPSWRGPPVLLI